MNCKPGDLAVMKRPWLNDEDIGRVVSVIRLGSKGERVTMRNGGFSSFDSPLKSAAWLVDAHHHEFPCFVADECLRPIRPQPDDAVDEVIQRIGTPHKEVA